MPTGYFRAVAFAALLALAAPAGAQSAGANPPFFRADLSGANEAPPNSSTGSGYVFGFLNGTQLKLTGRFRGLQANYTMSHIHVGAAGTVGGGIIFNLTPTVDGDQRSGRFLPASNTFTLSPAQLAQLLTDNYYVNVHSTAFQPGEIRDQLRPSVVLSEIRTDQTDADNNEYFELAGPAGASLNGYTYLVIGDGTGVSGVIEEVLPLDGQTIPGDSYFLVAESTFTLGTPDFVADINFENSDGVTHLLVSGFTGADGDDLDTNDDGTLDATPWTEVIDAFGFADDDTELAYGAALGFEDGGPVGTFPPAHAFRNGGTGAWQLGVFDAFTNDTPGAANATVPTAAEPSPEAPAAFRLEPAYPNPFNPSTTLRFSLGTAASVRLAVFDAVGREVAVLAEGPFAAGEHDAVFDAAALPSGAYLVRLEADGRAVTQTVTLAK